MSIETKKRIIIAMSGGVDSSVAAALLKEQGHDLIGIFMHFWAEAPSNLDSGVKNKCCSLDSFNDARRVAQKLGFPLYTINLDEPFKRAVVDDFLAGYDKGETPNPCVNCNKFIKFDLLLKKADDLGVDLIATGHYAKIKEEQGSYHLYRADDTNKDQTYFLYTLNQAKLKRIIFPLSNYVKPEVRQLAKKYGLEVAEKQESQEICFVPEKSHNEFLKRHLEMRPGEIRTLDDKRVGEHQGLPLYTIGQRKGVEIGGIGPFYVVRTDLANNILYVSNNGDDPAIYKDELTAKEVNWISGKEPKLPFKCEAVIRYRHQPVDCIIKKEEDDRYLVRFDKPQRAITQGQSVVFYHGDELLGGGVIE